MENFGNYPAFLLTNACGRPLEAMPELTPDALAKFEKAVTDEVFMERLLGFALRKKRAHYWRGIWDGHLPGGKEVTDIVQEAIDDVLLGKRAWDPSKHPDLLHFLRSVVNSKISHLLEGAENRKSQLAPAGDTEEGVDHFEMLPDTTATNAVLELQEKEDEENNSELILRFYDFVADDPLVQGVVGCMIDGLYERSEIAAALQRKGQDITNANKRL
jgi:hypothetical protein